LEDLDNRSPTKQTKKYYKTHKGIWVSLSLHKKLLLQKADCGLKTIEDVIKSNYEIAQKEKNKNAI
jgi:hypothetical protein